VFQRIRAGLGFAGFLAAILVAATPHGLTAERGPTVFAAASLKTALDAVAEDWQHETGTDPVISYAATSALAKQIEQGAEADVFISADLDWMDYVEERGLIDPKSRFDLLANQLVLITLKNSGLTARIEPGLPLAKLLGGGRLAIANVDAVPAGKYGKAALQSLGLWDAVKDELAQAENVRAALRLVARGEAPLGIVYASDAKADPSVTVLGVFPEAAYPPIVYPAARLKDACGPQTEAFLAYLRSPDAARRFEANGFAPIGSR
jgi:molybdate transport system substrate-binding protein